MIWIPGRILAKFPLDLVQFPDQMKGRPGILRMQMSCPVEVPPSMRPATVPEELKTFLTTHPTVEKCPWHIAVHYTLKRWEQLTCFVKNGAVEIDNNLIENRIRPIAPGRKNYLFAGSHDAAERAGIFLH